MYLEYYGLARAPYGITPDTELFFAGGERGVILDALVYAIVKGEAITKVVGEVGSGKTMLCRMLEHKLPNSVEIVYLANPSLAPENVLHAIAFELDLAINADDNRLKVMKALQEYLLARHAENRQVVVFVEEAQGMPLATLEEIRLLSNLETQRHKLLQVVLFGQPELDVGLSAPHVRQIKERITNSFYLPPLKKHEIGAYLGFRLHLAGSRGGLTFSPLATWIISCYSHGLMRRINIIADKALLAAYASGSQAVGVGHVISALKDCEFIRRGVLLRPVLLTAITLFMVLGLGGWAQLDSLAAVTPAATQTATQTVTPIATQTITSVAPVITQPPQTVANVEALSLLEQRFQHSADWFSTADPSHLTIHILHNRSSDTRSLERFLTQTENDDESMLQQLFVYRAGTDAQNVTNVVMGEYTTASQARTALAALPPRLKKYQPYLRNIKNVLAEARSVVGD